MAPRMPLPSCIMQSRRPLIVGFAVLLVSACSGADPTELFAPVAQEGSPSQPIGGDGLDGGGVVTSSSSSSSSGGASSSSSGGASSSSTGGSPPSTPADAGTTPPPDPDGCIAESEPNDDASGTDWFTKCFTGALKKGDHDFASISAPVGARSIEIDHDENGGNVTYRIYINNVPSGTFTDEPPRFIPVFGGATYSFEMTPAGGGSGNRTYKLDVKFE